jgi:hypothetical protein
LAIPRDIVTGYWKNDQGTLKKDQGKDQGMLKKFKDA